MVAGYDAAERLAIIAAGLGRPPHGGRGRARGGAGGLPALFLFTDPTRTPDPVAAAERLPPGCGVVYRHFGAPDRARMARRLRAACDAGGHVLLIAADAALARATDADGVHWPAWAHGMMTRGVTRRFAVNTAAAHDARETLRAAQAGADIVFLSPVFRSGAGAGSRRRAPLGALRAGAIARLGAAPVYALGGVDESNARRLEGTGIAGIAAVGALAGPELLPPSAGF